MAIARKLKNCKGCNTPQYIWARGMCKACDAKNKPVGETKAREPIKRVSDKQQRLNSAYNVLASAYKKAHPVCELRIVCSGATTQDIHHVRSRGEYLNDTTTWKATCRDCHNWCHDNHAKAVELGFIKSKLHTND